MTARHPSTEHQLRERIAALSALVDMPERDVQRLFAKLDTDAVFRIRLLRYARSGRRGSVKAMIRWVLR